MNPLGVYFGPKLINLVETKGKRLIHSIQISQATISSGEILEEKVAEEAKMVTLFKNELKANGIEAKEAAFAFSGKDLIIRTFEMPLMPRDELEAAVNFEVKKYIPFKVEDLISDFQVQLDKANRRNLVLFIGIKKEILDKYLGVFSQLNIKVNAIEYSAFSVLRLLRLNAIKTKGILGLVAVDFKEEDEVNFTVLDNGFPLFSRDITLSGRFEGPQETGEEASALGLEKLKTEIRVSLDYYHRKFPNKNIKKLILITGQDYRLDLESFIKELGLSVNFIDAVKGISRGIGRPVLFSLSFIKGYSSSLYKIIKIGLKINLLAPKAKTKIFKEAALELEAEEASLLTGLKIEPKIIALSLVICAMTFISGIYRILPFQKELNNAVTVRPKASIVSSSANLEQLKSTYSQYANKVTTIDKLIKQQLYLTEPLDIIPQVIPENVWLTNFSFRKEEHKTELTLEGMSYVGDSVKEFALVNNFVLSLKQEAAFIKYFKEIEIISLDRRQFKETPVTNFVTVCRSRAEE